MPADERVRGAVTEVAEQLDRIGYEPTDVTGPVTPAGDSIPLDEVSEYDPERVRYYLISDTDVATFYIQFGLDREYGTVVYPMNVLRHLGSYLDKDEVRTILGEDVEEDEDGRVRGEQRIEAVKAIIENTDPSQYHTAVYNLSAYATTALVDFHQTTLEDGFPVEFQCTRGIFPYTGRVSPKVVDDRVQPVLIAGGRGSRYVQYSYRIDKEDKDPSEYEFVHLI